MATISNEYTKLIDSLVVAYNAQDVRAFADHFSEDAWHGNLHAAEFQQGREAIYARYVEAFNKFPENKTEVLHRIVIGNRVIDHERVSRSPGGETFEVVAINTIVDGKVARLEMIRA
jgi:uncharacterized protein (TIGR02246 family)